MTNREAIKQLKFLKKVDFHIDTKEACDIAIDLFQENDKLKAEIEQYKSALTTWNNANNEMLKFNQELKDENEQLKSELEQSIKLPCKVGDVVFDTSDWVVKDYIVKLFNIVVEVEDNRKYDCNLISFHEEQIGCKIFLTREEAEQALKGKVEDESRR